ncbi:L2 core protein precursor pVII [Human adenovirus 40]|nr:L2 core protein precursor pVII [Human adenovirus 40]UZE90855.1 L2 core protein precursor pVII [Human adenovirus 40]UZE90978.1 L2 core protein precursor pVII [Human adenovirus 40]UZE91009.1 L2 core protein precursor pVII [Human adenovirus 40]UZE91037.1 L2 core protein precursor pVII [Human adenovirus 40]
MSILISPDNNTGWGLSSAGMYGGAKRRSSQHPVRVRGHYRAPWGAYTRGVISRRTTVDDVIDSVVADAQRYTRPVATSTVDSVIDSVVANARRYAQRKRRLQRRRRRPTAAMTAARAVLRRAQRIGRRAMRRAAASASAGRARRQAARQAAAAIASMAQPRRGNIYWVRDASGVRVPVRSRPPRS